MAKCCYTGERFVNFVFSPCIAVYTTSDVNEVCKTANLRFCELLKPFSQLTKDVAIRDNSNLLHTITNLRVKFIDPSAPPPPIQIARSHLKDVVSFCSDDCSMPSNVISNEKISTSVPVTTPWFEAWRYVFITSLKPNLYEFLDHCVAAIFVVSTTHPDPIAALNGLSQLQQQQQTGEVNGYPRWFNSSIAKFFVILHAPSKHVKFKPEDLHLLIEKTFGARNCYLLTIFSTSEPPFANTLANGNTDGVDIEHADNSQPETTQADPWISFLLPHGYRCNAVLPDDDSDVSKSQAPHTDPLFMRDHHEGGRNENNTNFGVNEWPLVHPRLLKPHGHGLSRSDLERLRTFVYDFVVRCLLPWVEQTSRGLNEQIAHRMKLSRSFLSATKKFFSSAVSSGASSGQLPHPHSTNSLISSGQSLIGTAGSGSMGPTLPVIHSESALMHVNSKENMLPQSSVVYSKDSAEMQMRRLADLAFLFQQYELAYQTYSVLRKDFQNDNAFVYAAGAHEMSALSVFMQGSTSQRQYPYHYVDAAVTDYLKTPHTAELALRATLLNAEALQSRGLYPEMTQCLLRLVSEDDDLTSALLLEQTAYCVLRAKRPQLRKFAFRMALAAFRYHRARQYQLSIRCYRLASPILSNLGWNLIEDHINYNLGKQFLTTGNLEAASKSLRQCLLFAHRQTTEQQATFIRDYLVTLKAFLADCQSHGRPMSLPDFPLPVVSIDGLKVMLGKPTRVSDNLPIEARDVQFSDEDEAAAEVVEPPESFYSRGGSSHEDHAWFPWWMEGTDVSESSSNAEEANEETSPWDIGSNDTQRIARAFTLTNTRVARCLEWVLHHGNCQSSAAPPPKRLYSKHSRSRQFGQPSVPVGEFITCQLPLQNPTNVPLILTNVHLLWRFRHPNENVTSNDCPTDAESDPRHVVSTDRIPELIMLAGENKQFELSLKAKKPGELSITGVSFEWNHVIRHSLPEPKVQFTTGDHPSSDDSAHPLMPEDVPAPSQPVKQVVRGKVTFHPGDGNLGSPLTWIVAGEAPLLEVYFSELPSKLFQGQIYRMQTTLRNAGHGSLTSIRFASNWPGAFTFPSSTGSRVSIAGDLFQHLPRAEHVHLESSPIHPWLPVPLQHQHSAFPMASQIDSMDPGASFTVPLWFRAPHVTHPHFRRRPVTSRRFPSAIPYPYSSGMGAITTSVQSRTVHMVFQYTGSGGAKNSRFVRHRFEMELHPSLRLEAVAHRSPQADARNLLIQLRVRNKSSKSSKHNFELSQISCVSRYWTVTSMLDSGSLGFSPCVINPANTLTLFLVATSISPREAGERPLSLSTLSFGRSHSTSPLPCTDFYFRSGVHWRGDRGKSRISPAKLDIALIVSWKLHVDGPDGFTAEDSVIGQSHVAIRKLEHWARVPLEMHPNEPTPPASLSPPSCQLARLHLHHVSHVRCPWPPNSSSATLAAQSLMHRSPLALSSPPLTGNNDASPCKRFITIPIQAEVYNTSSSRIVVWLDSVVSDGHDLLTGSLPFPEHFHPHPRKLPTVFWIGLVGQRLALEPSESRTVTLTACVVRPGYYSTANLIMKACFSDREEAFATQPITPTFILVSPR